MKHLVVLASVVALASIAVAACSDDSGNANGTGSPDPSSDGGGADSTTGPGPTTDAGNDGAGPSLPTYETWRLIKNPTATEDTATSVAANAEQVFISGTEDGKGFVESRNVATGAVQWRVEIPKAATLAANGAYVATGADQALTLRSAADGTVVWTKSTDRPVGVLSINATHVFAGGTSFAPYPSKVSAWSAQSYDLANGNATWTSPVGAGSSYGDYLGGLAVTADALYLSFTSGNGPYTRNWYAAKHPLVGGQPESLGGWSVPLTGSSFNGASGLVADAQRVYVTGIVSDVGQVVALNASDGAELWRKSPPSTLPFTPGLLFGGIPFLDPNGVMIFGVQSYQQKRSATYLLGATDGAESRVVEHFAGATTAAAANGHLFVAGTWSPNEAGTDTQWEVDNVKYSDGQFSATSHVELK